jgi:oligosaccharide repeat unit polymerase
MSEGWVPSLIPAVLIVVLTVLARRQSDSWLVPGVFFPMIWSGYVFIPMLAAPDYEVNPLAVWYILLSCLMVSLGCLFGTNILPKSGNKRQGYSRPPVLVGYSLGNPRHVAMLCRLVLVSVILGLLSGLIVVWFSGRSLVSLLSLGELFALGHELSVGRYTYTYIEHPLSQAFLAFVYAAPMFGGLLFSLKPARPGRLMALLSFMPGLFSALVNTTRAAILFPGVFWVAGYFSARVLLDKGNVRLFIKQRVLLVSVLAPISIAVAVFLQMSRSNLLTLDVIPDMLIHIRPGMFGHLAVFSWWFTRLWDSDIAPYFGVANFSGPFRLLGIISQELRLYAVSVEVGYNQFSNLYTLFFALILDFTWIGALLVLFLGGAIAGRAYYGVTRGTVMYLPVLVAFYAVTLVSFAQNVFTYNSIILAWLMFAGYLLTIRRRPPTYEAREPKHGKGIR